MVVARSHRMRLRTTNWDRHSPVTAVETTQSSSTRSSRRRDRSHRSRRRRSSGDDGCRRFGRAVLARTGLVACWRSGAANGRL